jgi:hypothetical protein
MCYICIFYISDRNVYIYLGFICLSSFVFGYYRIYLLGLIVYGGEYNEIINGLLLTVSALVGIILLKGVDFSQFITTNFPRRFTLILTRHVI